jgi:GT2 family glycosyltransferase
LNPTSVTAIVVNYNTGYLLHEALDALALAAHGIALQTVIVDNASKDDSAALMRRDFAQHQLIFNDQNVGFGRANNQAVPLITGDYVLLLNTDAFVQPETLRETLAYMQAHPRCGVLGVQLVGRDGAWQPSARYFPTPWNLFLKASGLARLFPGTRLVDDEQWHYDTPQVCDWVPGCYYLVRREVVDRVGLFDPRYFLYYEEVDHCFAVKQAGWDVVCYPHTRVVHIGGESAKSDGAITQSGRQLQGLQVESQQLYFRKNMGVAGLLSAVVLTLLADLINAGKCLLGRRAGERASAHTGHAGLYLSTLWRTRVGTQATR